MNEHIGVSEHLSSLHIGGDSFVIWNRFHPCVLKINKAGLDFIDDCKKTDNITVDDENKDVLELLLKYKILFIGDYDLSREDFSRSVHSLLDKVSEHADIFYKNQSPYSKLTITNDSCNLKCSYCLNNYKNPSFPTAAKYDEKLNLVNQLVDQFFKGLLKNGINNAEISFNGGEILLEWPLIENLVKKITHEYADVNTAYALNTNMTLVNKEIAQFLNNHNFKVFISIDGYKSAHNRTRRYQNGSGSFDDIIRGLEIYREYNTNYFIDAFQGTVEHVDEFEPGEVYQMRKYGFREARLAPNLLNISIEDAIKKAKLMGRFIDLNVKNSFKVTEVYFRNMEKLIDRDDYSFFFNCKGLSSFPEMRLTFNINTARVSHLCSYIPAASLSLKELGYDIYNPYLWECSKDFIKSRMDALFSECINCELIGICRGGCIYTGLDNENKLNKSACVYQEKLWKIFLEKVYENSESSENHNS